MTLRLVPQDPFLHLTVVPELAVLHADRRGVELNAYQVAIIREASAELREQGFQMYPAILDGIVRRFEAAAASQDADERLADEVEREGAWAWPTRRTPKGVA